MTFRPIKHNLPAEPNSFVGRERDIDELCAFLDTTRAVTLCGTGGIGKTRLALRVVASLSDEFPDGVWLVELADLLQPDLLAFRVAATIGITEEIGRPLLETLAEALRPRRLLLVLDNCEHMIEASALLCQRLLASSPGLRVVATSREPLRVPAETVWRVPPLSIPLSDTPAPGELDSYEAIRLFVERAAAVRPGFGLTPENTTAVVRLCRALDGVPLAIELAAARVRALSVEQIAARLGDRFPLLGTGDRTAPPRQRTLRAAIDWSHELLTEREQMLLRRVALFAGWSLEMAEQMCAGKDLTAADVLDLTTALVDKSLVVVEPELHAMTRYRLLDSIRQYATERQAAAGEAETMQDRGQEYALEIVERSSAVGMAAIPAPWRTTVDSIRRYDVDEENIQQVLTRCLKRGLAETGLRICAGLWPLWILRGSFAEGTDWIDRFLGLGSPGTGLSPRTRGSALVGRAQLAISSDPAQAESYARAGLELCRAADDATGEATALNTLAEAGLRAGRTGDTAALLDEALSISRKNADARNEGYALGTQAGLAALSGKLREAQVLGEAALDVMLRIDHLWGAARALLGLGMLARFHGDLAGARRHYLAALAILREVEARPEIARCLAGIGRVALDQGDIALAREHLAESLRLSQSTGARIGVARGLEAFASLAAQLGQSSRAVRLIAASAALREAAGFRPLSGARTEQYLTPARNRLTELAVAQAWTQGRAMTSDEAVAFALHGPQSRSGNGQSEVGQSGNGSAAIAARSAARGLAIPPSTLTRREREIAALVAEGRSNRAIAGDLFISQATAARHVANIHAKLGFTSRTQIAAWVVDTDPAGQDQDQDS